MSDPISDEQLARQVQQGNIEQFGLLVERYETKLTRYARRFLFEPEDAQDLLQNVFLKAYANIQAFNPNRKFSSWLYRIAHNEFINAIKKRGKEPLPLFDTDTFFPHPLAKDNPVQELSDKELSLLMDQALNQLDPKYREPLVLYYFEQLDYEAIADILLLPKSTVGVRLNRAKTLLKDAYNQLNHGPN